MVKKKISWIKIILVQIAISLFIFFGLIYGLLLFPTFIQKNNVVYLEKGMNATQIIKNTAHEVYIDKRTYSQNYDCTNYARDFVKSMKNIGFSAYCVSGYYDDGFDKGRHTWNEVIIENETYTFDASRGGIVQGDSLSYYKVWYKGFCL